MSLIRILLADDHPLFRDGVARTLEGDPAFTVVGQAGSADEAVALAQDLLPDLALLDISMPGSGLEAARRISQTCPVVKIVMLTVSEQDQDVMTALKAGARGYILKGIGGQALTRVLQDVYRGESYVSPSLAARLLAEMQQPGTAGPTGPSLADLTAREEQILKLVAQGQSNKEVGRTLDLQEKTIKHYMSNILQKLQVRNRVEAALIAREHFAGGSPEPGQQLAR